MEVTQLIALLEANGFSRNEYDCTPDCLLFEKGFDTACIEDGVLTLFVAPNEFATPCETVYRSYAIESITERNGKLILPEPFETVIF